MLTFDIRLFEVGLLKSRRSMSGFTDSPSERPSIVLAGLSARDEARKAAAAPPTDRPLVFS